MVLRRPWDGPDPTGWVSKAWLSVELADMSELAFEAEWLIPQKLSYLPVGGHQRIELPVPADQVAASAIGSLTNRLWVESATDALWLNNHDRRPRLDDWLRGFEPAPQQARLRLAIDEDEIRVLAIDT